MDILEKLDTARQHAHNGGIPVRRKDGKLYALLSECLSICEEVIAEGMFEELRQLARVSVNERKPRGTVTRNESNNGRGRNYVEKGSDAFILVCRYVLSGVDERNSSYRYATTLREAHRRSIKSQELSSWLKENGGVNALYGRAIYKGDISSKRTLHLNEAVSFPREGEFTIRLKHDGKGFFDVVQKPLRCD
jgi:hypothetical protein